jgi:CBS domain-containing protein
MAGKLVGKLAKRDCFSLNKSDTLLTASKAMSKYNLGAMPVLDQNDSVIGIVSERDIARNLHQDDFKTNKLIVEIMTKEVITCDLNISVTELMETMTNKKIRHMLIMEENKLLGVVSIGDVVNHIIEQFKEENENLRNYINNF